MFLNSVFTYDAINQQKKKKNFSGEIKNAKLKTKLVFAKYFCIIHTKIVADFLYVPYRKYNSQTETQQLNLEIFQRMIYVKMKN